MKRKILEKISIPEGVSCQYENKLLKCSKGSLSLERKIIAPITKIKIENSEIIFEFNSGNKNNRKMIMTNIAHIKNIFKGLQEPFIYKLEVVNVHFPMTLKVEGAQLAVSNFLGEKKPRRAEILHDVEVEVKGHEITVSSPDREAAGQTAANFEKATKLKGRDRRIFQDGVYITEKPGGKI
mgnify:FL=1